MRKSAVANSHTQKRHVLGLKLGSGFFALLNFLFLITVVLIPLYELPSTVKGITLIHLLFFVSSASISLLVSEKNYKLLLVLAVAQTFVFYLLYRFFQTIDAVERLANPSDFAGRSGDYQFLLCLVFIIASVLYLRFSIVTLICVCMTFFCAFEVYGWYSTFSELFFTSDYELILSNPNAVNKTFFIANIQVMITAVVTALLASWYIERLTNEASEVERSNNELSRYFSPDVKEEIEKTGMSLTKPDRNKSLVAVLFTDINQFSTLTEEMDPSEVLDLVSAYQTKMVAAIFASGGTVDKFIGDAVMATFGTPISRGNDAQNAFECARSMQVSMRQWAKEREEQNLVKITHRIGVHFGECVIGNVGSDQRREYTVLGDSVNVASRLCDACKELDAEVLISEEIRNRISEVIDVEPITNFNIRGRKGKLKIYSIKL